MSLPPERKRRSIIVERAVQPRSHHPKDLLEQVYRVVKRDIDQLESQTSITEAQSRIVRDHGRFLIEAAKELRQQQKDEAARMAAMSDEELLSILEDPQLRAHLKQLIKEYECQSK